MDDTFSTRRALGLLWVPAALATLAASWLPGCANFHGTTAASFLKTIREDPDPNVRFLAYHKLGSPNVYDHPEQKAEAIQALVAKLGDGSEPVASRAVICRTLGELADPSAREALIKAVGDPEGLVRTQACRALGRVGRPEDATLLTRVMAVDTLEDCRIAAIEGLGAMKARDPRIVEVLIGGMDHDDPAIRLASLKALRTITGKDLGVEPGPWRKEFPGQVAAAAPPASAAATDPASAPERR